jgi:DNA-binding LytR/AlgR family response regulator
MDKSIRILVVEDEFMISEDIAMRLSDFGYVVEGTAPSAKAALEILEKGKVDLALVDINIEGDMDGIQLAEIIGKKYKIPFIFLTSLAAKAIVERAKHTHPSAYLLKPFNDRQVQIAIDMALVNYSSNEMASLHETPEKFKPESCSVISIEDSLFLKRDMHYDRVRYSDINYLMSHSNYTAIHAKSGTYMYACIIKHMEDKLPVNKFIRVHRSYIVNIDEVTGFEGSILFIGNVQIPISKPHREELFKAFKMG